MPLSYLSSYAVGVALLDEPLNYVFSLVGLWLWLVTAVVLAAIASFFPVRHAAQLTVREVLAYE